MTSSVRIEDLQRKYEQDSRRYFAPLASELRRAGDARRAVALCEAGLAADPEHLSGHVVLAQALADLGDSAGAERSFSRAIELDPENIVALRSLGDLARDRGDREAARGWYQHALEADPRDPELATRLSTLDSTAAVPSPPVSPSASVPTSAAVDAPVTRDDVADTVADTTATAAAPAAVPAAAVASEDATVAAGGSDAEGEPDIVDALHQADEPAAGMAQDVFEAPLTDAESAELSTEQPLLDDDLAREFQQQREAEEFTAGFFAAVLEADRAASGPPRAEKAPDAVESLPEADVGAGLGDETTAEPAASTAAEEPAGARTGASEFLDDLLEFPSESDDRSSISSAETLEAASAPEPNVVARHESDAEALAESTSDAPPGRALDVSAESAAEWATEAIPTDPADVAPEWAAAAATVEPAGAGPDWTADETPDDPADAAPGWEVAAAPDALVEPTHVLSSEASAPETHSAFAEGSDDEQLGEPLAAMEDDGTTASAKFDSPDTGPASSEPDKSGEQAGDGTGAAQWREEIPSQRSRVEIATDVPDGPQPLAARWIEAFPAESPEAQAVPEEQPVGQAALDEHPVGQAALDEPPADQAIPDEHPAGQELLAERKFDAARLDQPAAVADHAGGQSIGEEPSRLPFVTATMGKLLLQQGFRTDALRLFRQLAEQHPDDSAIRDQVAELEAELHPAGVSAGGVTVGHWLRDLARMRPASGGEEDADSAESDGGQTIAPADVAAPPPSGEAPEEQAAAEASHARHLPSVEGSGSDLLSSAEAAAASAVTWETGDSDPSIDDFLFSDDPLEWGEVSSPPADVSERASDLTLDELLGRPVSSADEMAAGALASVTLAMQHDAATDAQLAEASAEDPGALEHLLAGTSAADVVTTRETGSFSFEQFFQVGPAAGSSEQAGATGPSTPSPAESPAATRAAGTTGDDEEAAVREADLADFHAWLAGLSKS